MKFLRTLTELTAFLEQHRLELGCLADTSFLYALSYQDDRLYSRANDVSDILAETNIPIYTNVIGRVEFIDLIFRKQITFGAIELFATLSTNSTHRDVYNLLKNIRDQDTAHRRDCQSFKISEGRLKDLRTAIENAVGPLNWRQFCGQYAGSKLFSEWQIIEQELGLNFIEILEGQVAPFFKEPVTWSDMVQVMSDQGIRAPDAMIANLFAKSKFKLLVTGDKDFEACFSNSLHTQEDQAILFL